MSNSTKLCGLISIVTTLYSGFAHLYAGYDVWATFLLTSAGWLTLAYSAMWWLMRPFAGRL